MKTIFLSISMLIGILSFHFPSPKKNNTSHSSHPSKTEKSLFEGGSNWGGNIYAKDIAFGDIDGDGRDEIGVVRAKGFGFNLQSFLNPDKFFAEIIKSFFNKGEIRFIIYDDASTNFKILFEGGKDWGDANSATSIAFGDVDGDGNDEIGVTRFARTNGRYIIYDFSNGNVSTLLEGGTEWGDAYFGTSIAFGNIDGDKAEEFAVGRFSSTNNRLWLYDDKNNSYKLLGGDGNNWGAANAMITSLAFGDVDGDGIMELGITRQSFSNERYFIYRYANNRLNIIHKGGAGWGNLFQASDIGFGDLDGDKKDEFTVTRYSTSGPRYFIGDDEKNGFKHLGEGGNTWGTGFSATAVDFGDINGDGKEEMILGRLSPTNERYWVRTYQNNGIFEDWVSGGNKWGSKIFTTAIATGDVDGDGKKEYGLARHADTPIKFIIAKAI